MVCRVNNSLSLVLSEGGKKYGNCDLRITSEISLGKYALLLLYMQAVLAVLAIPLILALAGGGWRVVVVFFVMIAVMVFPLSMALHARNAAKSS